MLEQTQNPFLDSSHNKDILFASILIFVISAVGIISIIKLQKTKNENN